MARKNVLKKIDRDAPLSQKIEEQLRDAIIRKVFSPGERLPSETELVDVFGVSRTAIREALRILAGKGLVEIRGRGGVYVADADLSQLVHPFTALLLVHFGDSSLFHLVQSRRILEPEIARMAAMKRTQEDIDYLQRNISQMRTHLRETERIIEVDIDFHKRLASASGNPIVPILMEPIFLCLPKLISVNFKLEYARNFSIKEHSKILECVIDQDADGAHAAMSEHMATAEKHVSEYYKTANAND